MGIISSRSSFVDVEGRDEQKKEEIKRLARESNPIRQPEPIKIIHAQPKFPFEEMVIVPLFDIHSGAIGANAAREELAVEWIKRVANAWCVLGGDTFNSTIQHGRDVHEDAWNNMDAIKRAIDLYVDLVMQGKMAAILAGNHDGGNGNNFKDKGVSLTALLAEALKPYDFMAEKRIENLVHACEFGALLQFDLPTRDGNRANKEVSVFMCHGSGMGSNPAASVESEYIKAVAWLMALGIRVDAIITGHHHSNSNGVIRHPFLVKENGKVKKQMEAQTYVISESTLLERANYALANNFPPADSNVYIYKFWVEKNVFHVNGADDNQPEFVVKYERTPMFRKNSNEYTQEALDIMRAHPEPDRNKMFEDMTRRNNDKLKRVERNRREKFNNARFASQALKQVGSQALQSEGPQMPVDEGLGKGGKE